MRPSEAEDVVGATTLERMAVAPRYNKWTFERLRPWVGKRILEVGAGIGNLSVFFAERERVVLTDTEPYYLERLSERFRDHLQVRVTEMRLPEVESSLVAEHFDTIVCSNVLEHIEDDRASLRAMRLLLQPGGRLVLLVPALRALYGTLDEALGHFRRYTPRELSGMFEQAGFRVRRIEYFNLAGVPAWWFTGRVLRRRVLSAGALRWYDALVPLFRLERLLPWRIGQSLIVIGEVPA